MKFSRKIVNVFLVYKKLLLSYNTPNNLYKNAKIKFKKVSQVIYRASHAEFIATKFMSLAKLVYETTLFQIFENAFLETRVKVYILLLTSLKIKYTRNVFYS